MLESSIAFACEFVCCCFCTDPIYRDKISMHGVLVGKHLVFQNIWINFVPKDAGDQVSNGFWGMGELCHLSDRFHTASVAELPKI